MSRSVLKNREFPRPGSDCRGTTRHQATGSPSRYARRPGGGPASMMSRNAFRFGAVLPPLAPSPHALVVGAVQYMHQQPPMPPTPRTATRSSNRSGVRDSTSYRSIFTLHPLPPSSDSIAVRHRSRQRCRPRIDPRESSVSGHETSDTSVRWRPGVQARRIRVPDMDSAVSRALLPRGALRIVRPHTPESGYTRPTQHC